MIVGRWLLVFHPRGLLKAFPKAPFTTVPCRERRDQALGVVGSDGWCMLGDG